MALATMSNMNGPRPRGMRAPKEGEARVTVRFSLEGETELMRTMNALQVRLDDWSPALPELDRIIRAKISQVFESEGAWGGGEKWAPLKPATQAARRREGYGAKSPILRRTNTLYSSLTSRTGDTISLHHPTRYALGSAVPYFGYHQSLSPRRVIPRRPIVKFDEADKADIFLPIRRWYTGHDPAAAVRSRPRPR